MKFQYLLLFTFLGFVISNEKDFDLKIEYKTKDNKLKKKEFTFKNKNQMNKAIKKEIKKAFPNEIPGEIQEFLNTLEPNKSKKNKNLKKNKKSKKNKTNSENNNMSYYFKINTQKILSPQQQKENNENFENEESEYVFDGKNQHNESFDAEFFESNGDDNFIKKDDFNDDFFKKDHFNDDFFKKESSKDDFFENDNSNEDVFDQ